MQHMQLLSASTDSSCICSIASLSFQLIAVLLSLCHSISNQSMSRLLRVDTHTHKHTHTHTHTGHGGILARLRRGYAYFAFFIFAQTHTRTHKHTHTHTEACRHSGEVTAWLCCELFLSILLPSTRIQLSLASCHSSKKQNSHSDGNVGPEV